MRIIAFVNKGSGGNEGAAVLEFLRNELGEENVFDIKADKGPARGLDERAMDPAYEVRVIVAGGDGTFSWVADAVEKRNLSNVRLIVIPLGSGNDMSRALGWGKKFPGMPEVGRYLKLIPNCKAHKLDVWRLNAVNDSSIVPVDDDGVEHGARPLVCNYLSLGADAFVELRFNQLRWESPEKYKSRLGNFKAHMMVGAKYMCTMKSKKIHVAEHIESLLIDDKLIEIPPKLQAIIFLNIPSYGAGTQPWGFLRKEKQSSDVDKGLKVNNMFVDDQQFEVIGLKSLSHFGAIKLFGGHGVRIAQGRRMKLKLKTPSTPFQVDGEPWEQLGGEVSLEPGNRVGVLEGPVWTGQSKKNAKFTPEALNGLEEPVASPPSADREANAAEEGQTEVEAITTESAQ